MTVQETSFMESALQASEALARTMQRTLVPPITFANNRLQAYGRTIACDTLGGDLADLVTSPGDAVAYVADVSGHDVSAGMLMGMVKIAARYGLMLGQSLPDLLGGINRVLPFVKEPNMYATFAGLRLNGTNEMEYTIAGNLPILHYRQASEKVARLSMEQFPLGLFPDATYSSGRVDCATGDLFAIFTDGLVETTDVWEEEFGLQRLETVLCECAGRRLPDIYHAAVDAVGRHGRQFDDRTLMLIRVLGPFGDIHAA